MSVPDFQSLMLPVLKVLVSGAETPISDVRERVAAAAGLTPVKGGSHPATDLLCYSVRGSLEAKYILIEHDVRNQETDGDGCVIHCA